MNFFLGWPIVRVYVSFREGTSKNSREWKAFSIFTTIYYFYCNVEVCQGEPFDCSVDCFLDTILLAGCAALMLIEGKPYQEMVPNKFKMVKYCNPWQNALGAGRSSFELLVLVDFDSSGWSWVAKDSGMSARSWRNIIKDKQVPG